MKKCLNFLLISLLLIGTNLNAASASAGGGSDKSALVQKQRRYDI